MGVVPKNHQEANLWQFTAGGCLHTPTPATQVGGPTPKGGAKCHRKPCWAHVSRRRADRQAVKLFPGLCFTLCLTGALASLCAGAILDWEYRPRAVSCPSPGEVPDVTATPPNGCGQQNPDRTQPQQACRPSHVFSQVDQLGQLPRVLSGHSHRHDHHNRNHQSRHWLGLILTWPHHLTTV